MANPPITIGPFDNVPAPGSPVRSDWAQEISHYVTGLSIVAATRVNTTVVGIGTANTVVTPTINIPAQSGWALIVLQLQVQVVTAPAAITAAVQGNAGATVATGDAGFFDAGGQQMFAMGILNLGGVANDLFGYARCNPGAANTLATGQLLVFYGGNTPA